MFDWILRLFSKATPPRRVRKPRRRSVPLELEQLRERIVPAKGTNGGAIENDGVTSIYGCSFTANNSVGNGGAIENTNELNVFMNMARVATAFNTNTAAKGNGGAIDSSGNGKGKLDVSDGTTFDKNSANMGGAISTSDPTTLANDFFGTATKNVATVGGGAVYATPGTQPNPPSDTLTSCTFASNQASFGEAVLTSATMDVEQSTFSNNQASTFGGGLEASYKDQPNNPMGNDQRLTLNLDTFDSNIAALEGGGAFILANATTNGHYQLYVTNDTFSNNKAQGKGVGYGGGLYLEEDTAGLPTNISATLTNLTFFMNTSDMHGGGLSLRLADSTGSNTEGKATLTSLTVNQNTAATDSGGMYIHSVLKDVVQVDNSIFDGNTVTAAGYNGPVDVTIVNGGILPLDDQGYNLVALSDVMFNAKTQGNQVNNNPGLAATLAANGAPAGYPLTLALQKNSPGYEKGNPDLTGFNTQGEDERGFQRQMGKVSIGAEDPDALPPG